MFLLGCFIKIPYLLGNQLLHKTFCYFHSHSNKPLTFPGNPASNERVLRVHWPAKKSEDFIFDNNIETLQDTNDGTDKIIWSSHGIDLHTFMGTT